MQTSPSPYASSSHGFYTPYRPNRFNVNSSALTSGYQSLSRPGYPSVVSSVGRPYTGHDGAMLDTENIQNKLTTSKATQVGFKNGLIAGLIGGIPIWAIEQYSKTPNLFQETAREFEKVFSPQNMKWTQLFARQNFLASVTGTALVGAITGSLLGGWMVSRVRRRLLDIHQAKQEQRQGIYTPKPATLLQQLGLADKPIDNPDMAYQHMLQEDLDEERAFWKGAKTIALLKVLPSILSLGVMLGCLFLMKRFSNSSLTKGITDQVLPLLKLSIHPVFIAKMLAFPIIGGFIAQQTVPWMREQLGVPKTPQAALTYPGYYRTRY